MSRIHNNAWNVRNCAKGLMHNTSPNPQNNPRGHHYLHEELSLSWLGKLSKITWLEHGRDKIQTQVSGPQSSCSYHHAQCRWRGVRVGMTFWPKSFLRHFVIWHLTQYPMDALSWVLGDEVPVWDQCVERQLEERNQALSHRVKRAEVYKRKEERGNLVEAESSLRPLQLKAPDELDIPLPSLCYTF